MQVAVAQEIGRILADQAGRRQQEDDDGQCPYGFGRIEPEDELHRRKLRHLPRRITRDENPEE